MQNQKKSFWMLAIVGAISLVLASGCGNEKPKDPVKPLVKTDDDNNTTPDDHKMVNLRDWRQVNDLAATFKPTAGKINQLAVSGDENWLYAHNGTELFAVKPGNDFTGIADDANWTKIGLAGTGLGAATAGNAELTGAVTVNGFTPTQKGALVWRSAAAKADNVDNGVGLLDGNTWTAAWAANATDITGLTAQEWLSAGVVRKGNDEYPILFNHGTQKFGVTAETAVNFAKVQLTRTVKSNTTNTFTGNVHVLMNDKDALIIDSVGIHTLAEASIGAAADLVTAAAITAASPNVGSEGWRYAAGAGVDNNMVNAVTMDGEEVVLALNSDTATDHTGGVVRVNIKTPAVKAPDAAWNKIAVLGFVTIDSELYAVTADGLFIVGKDGSKGAQFAAAAELPTDYTKIDPATPYSKNASKFPAKITDAKIVKGNLVLSTLDQGLIVGFVKQQKIPAPVATK